MKKDKNIFFIEHYVVGLWLTPEHAWTSDPEGALSFNSEDEAKDYATENGILGYVIREYEYKK